MRQMAAKTKFESQPIPKDYGKTLLLCFEYSNRLLFKLAYQLAVGLRAGIFIM